jgi:hypothetical protein
LSQPLSSANAETLAEIPSASGTPIRTPVTVFNQAIFVLHSQVGTKKEHIETDVESEFGGFLLSPHLA